MYTLGVNAAAASASACLVRGGRVVAAVQQARPAGQSAARRMPYGAIAHCLGHAAIAPHRLSRVVHVGAPAPLGTLSGLRHGDDPALPWNTHVVELQRAREAAVCLTSPHPAAAFLVIDGDGASCGTHDGQAITSLSCADRPCTAAALVPPIAHHLGFSCPSQADAVAALAPCGRPGYVPALRKLAAGAMAAVDWRDVLGPPRLPGQVLEQRHLDIAHSCQRVLEETVLDLAGWLHERTGARCLSLGGSAARNYLLAGALRARGAFGQVWVGAVPGDAGTAIGAALLLDARHNGGAAGQPAVDAMMALPCTQAQIEQLLAHSGLAYRRCASIAHDTAQLLAREQIVGWFQERPEPGGRALLAAPFRHATQERLQDITGRANLHTGAAMVPHEDAAAWFGAAGASPFQSFADHARPALAQRLAGVCHVDGSVRLHTVAGTAQPLLHQLLVHAGRLTGVPVLINAPLDQCLGGQASSPGGALALFASGAIDALAIGPFLLEKTSLRAP